VLMLRNRKERGQCHCNLARPGETNQLSFAVKEDLAQVAEIL
jgi:hypothetical protein